jgi:hypothetical protein
LGEITPDAVTILGNWEKGDEVEFTGTTVPVFLANFLFFDDIVINK